MHLAKEKPRKGVKGEEPAAPEQAAPRKQDGPPTVNARIPRDISEMLEVCAQHHGHPLAWILNRDDCPLRPWLAEFYARVLAEKRAMSEEYLRGKGSGAN